MSGFTVQFLTRPQCALCREAEPVVRRWTRRLGVAVMVVDVNGDARLNADFGVRIPVVLGPSGRVLAEGRVRGTKLGWELLRERLGAWGR